VTFTFCGPGAVPSNEIFPETEPLPVPLAPFATGAAAGAAVGAGVSPPPPPQADRKGIIPAARRPRVFRMDIT
jgi:hypothetical protein